MPEPIDTTANKEVIIPQVVDGAKATPPPEAKSDSNAMPHAEWKKDETFDTNEFFKAKNSEPPVIVEEKPVVVEDKTEEIVIDEPVVENKEEVTDPKETPEVVEQKPGDKQLEQANTELGFTDAEQRLIKKMAPESRAWVIANRRATIQRDQQFSEVEKQLKMVQSGRTVVPPSYYENQNAYLLLPETQAAQSNITISESILQHWRTQLRSIKNGQKWQDLEPLVDQRGQATGQYRTVEKEPSGDAEAEVMELLGFASKQVDTATQVFKGIQNGFQQRVQSIVNGIKEVEQHVFKSEGWSKKGAPEFETTQQIAGQLREYGITEANPLFNLFCKVAAKATINEKYINTMNANKGKQEAIATTTRAAGPSGSATRQGGSKAGAGNVTDVTIDDFKKLVR